MYLKSKVSKTYFTIAVFIALAAFDNIIIGLFPPLFKYIAQDLNVGISKLGIVSAVNILFTAVSSVYWGYLSGKFKRKRLIMIGTVIWVASVFLTAISKSYLQLLLFQIFTGIGLGCIASIGFSILTDYIHYEKRGMVLSLWGMAQGLGGIIGSLLASLTATSHSWRWPFEIVGFIGFLLIFLYFFVEEPSRGQSDPELKELVKKGQSYTYLIETQHIISILWKKSNVFLFLQAFFMNIATGSLIWIPTLFIFKIGQQGYSVETAMIASGYLYAIFQIGGMTSVYFGHLGDKFQKKSYKGRALFTSIFVILTMPFYIWMFNTPMDNLKLPSDSNAIFIFVQLIKQIFINPWMALLFVLSLAASAAQSANTPNWLALITDVNLPEHRGTAFSVANLFNSLGRTIGNLGFGILLGILSNHYQGPNGYAISLSVLQIFLIPSALCYFLMAKKNMSDIHHVKETLRQRSNELEVSHEKNVSKRSKIY
ncbi:MFS transporter [Neobacillus cucumis]|uniref:MFS transporter n=1 Tax=Neobacillus cucumis TaxID=1740721 RepID=UPI0028535A38|nr:MFS transporter [Neobacillus cucumis]MDR4946850.1 MFS transporter [Neobacillus cucumis]